MIQPQRIGRFLVVNEYGYIQPDVALNLVGDPWKPLVDFVLQSLMRRQGVCSVYIRGSIPRGLAIENVSDADFIYFSEIDFDSEDLELGRAAKAEFPFVQDLELFRLDHARFNKKHHPSQRPYFHMLLKTQSLFLAGDDIARNIAPFRLGPDMVSHVFAIANEFARLPNWLQEDRRRGVERSTIQWFSRRTVRSGFEVTMNRSDRFTRDLYLCYEQFSTFYPEWSGQMHRVLLNSLNGEESPIQYGGLVTFLASEGSRLLAK